MIENVKDWLRDGGLWIGAARNWIQWKCRNGSRVTWGSNDELDKRMTVRDVEDLALEVAAAAIEQYRDHLRSKDASEKRT